MKYCNKCGAELPPNHTLKMNNNKKLKDILELRKSKTLKEIGIIYGVTPERIRRLEALAKERLRIYPNIFNKY